MGLIRKDADLKQSELKEEKISDRKVKLRLRMSVRELVTHQDKLNAFLRAFKRIQELPIDHPNSFWVIAGYHGEPFDGTLWKIDKNAWGGYCQHANVLFPFWHRAYLLRMENALRSVMEPGDDVTLPYWDVGSIETLEQGVPEIFTRLTVDIDGVTVPNPLRSYEFPHDLCSTATTDTYYHKPKGYKTCRYPYSGIQSPPYAKKLAERHNSRVRDLLTKLQVTDKQALDANMDFWMLLKHEKQAPNSVYVQLYKCLQQPNYTVFANTTSASSGDEHGVPVEQPHNDIHIFTGGISDPNYRKKSGYEYLIPGANGDMSENESAAFDPIFYFHHCNIDRMLWVWQKKHNKTTTLKIEDDKDGTEVTWGNVTYGQKVGEALTLESQLKPFPSTPSMLIDIKQQCGYDYTIGSFDTKNAEPDLVSRSIDLSSEMNINEPDAAVSRVENIIKSVSKEKTNHRVTVHVTGHDSSIYDVKVGEEGGSANVWREDFVQANGFDKAAVVGSFIVRAWYSPPGIDRELIGQKGVLDRWDASICENCQKYRKTNISFSLGDLVLNQEKDIAFDIVCHDMEKGGVKVLPVSTSTNDNSGIKIDNVRFYSEFTNRPQDSICTDDGIRVDYRRPVAWEEARPVVCSAHCSVAWGEAKPVGCSARCSII